MKRIDRRALFASGAAAALLAASGMAAQGQPSRGGRLRVALPRINGSLDLLLRGAVFDTLTEVSPDGVLRGGLATGWTSNGDASVWDFTLREGVVFHDGASFGAADALASVAEQYDVDTGIVRAEALSPYRLLLELRAGNPHLPFILANPALAVCSADGCRESQESEIGTGLYATKRLDAGRYFLGQRVASHFKDGQAGWVDTVEAIVIPDPTVRAEALRDGFVDVAELPNSETLLGRGGFEFRPSLQNIALATRRNVGIPSVIGTRAVLDDGRIAERWWML